MREKLMRRLLLSLCLALGLATTASGASPEDAYLAERDQAIAKIKALDASKRDDDKARAADEAALAALQKRLIEIVGPVRVEGFAKTAKINLETLSQEGMGVDMLDGLAFAPTSGADDGSVLIATTKPLLEGWLKQRAAEPDATFRTPNKVEDALRSDNFYTFAFGADSAFGWAGEIGIAKPAGVEFAFAGIGRRAQIDDPTPVDRLVVAVIKGERALIAEVATGVQIPEYPTCKPIWTRAQAKSAALAKAYAAGGSKDDALDKAGAAATTEGARAWLACVGERAKQAPFYPALKRQAQDLAARMAGG
jgi:hypothetical protein